MGRSRVLGYAGLSLFLISLVLVSAGPSRGLPAEEAAGLNQAAKSTGATLFMVLLGVFNIF